MLPPFNRWEISRGEVITKCVSAPSFVFLCGLENQGGRLNKLQFFFFLVMRKKKKKGAEMANSRVSFLAAPVSHSSVVGKKRRKILLYSLRGEKKESVFSL